MIKKLFSLGLLFVMIISLVGCNQGITIDDYQAINNTTIVANNQESQYSENTDLNVNAEENKDSQDTDIEEMNTPNEYLDTDEWIRIERNVHIPRYEPSDPFWENSKKSLLAYEEAITYFKVDDKYTDDFGGVFLDQNGILNICVVGNREPLKSDYIIYKQVDNSLNFLDSIVDEMQEIMLELNIFMAGTHVSSNGVTIGIENENKMPILVEYLKSKNLFKKGTLYVVVGDMLIPNMGVIMTQEQQEIDQLPQEQENIELKIRQDYLRDWHARGQTNFTLDDVIILRNYGVYGESVVVKINRGAYMMLTTLIIDEVTFHFEDSNIALVWRNSHFYELEEAYNLGLISKADLIIIANIQNSHVKSMKLEQENI